MEHGPAGKSPGPGKRWKIGISGRILQRHVPGLAKAGSVGQGFGPNAIWLRTNGQHWTLLADAIL